MSHRAFHCARTERHDTAIANPAQITPHNRDQVWPDQGLASDCHVVRSLCPHLLLGNLSCRNRYLLSQRVRFELRLRTTIVNPPRSWYPESNDVRSDPQDVLEVCPEASRMTTVTASSREDRLVRNACRSKHQLIGRPSAERTSLSMQLPSNGSSRIRLFVHVESSYSRLMCCQAQSQEYE